MNIVKIYKLFPTEKDCLDHLEKVRWNNKPTCPYCTATNSTPTRKGNRYHCNDCNTTYSVTVGTIFHHTHLDLQKWFLALSLIFNAKKGIAARQLARDLGINKNTAWRISMKIREAMMENSQRELLSGIVEMDETYIGGKPRRRNHNNSGDGGNKSSRGRGTKKTPVVGMAQRKGKVIAKVMKKDKLKSKYLLALVRNHIDIENTTLITDEYRGYLCIKKFMPHQTINHQVWYVDGDIHTNTIESFWALLKRGIVGQFHKVSIKHLPKYIDEFCYRYNNRNNGNIFSETLMKAVGV